MSEKVVAFLYEYIGVPMPRGSLYVGMAVLGVIGAAFWLLFWGFAAKSFYTLNPDKARVLVPVTDTDQQQIARQSLRQLFNLHLAPANRELQEFWNAVAIQGSPLRQYGEIDIGRAWTGVADALNGQRLLTFHEIEERFAEYYAAYARLAEHTQKEGKSRSAIENDERYKKWNAADIVFIEQLKRVASEPELRWLYNQTAGQSTQGGDWTIFILRDQSQ